MFVATFVFSVLYFFIASVTNGAMSPVASYDRAVAAEMKKQMAGGVALKGDAATLLKLIKDEESMKMGANIFSANCVACHGRDGSGVTGPNLTDDSYIHVTKVQDIYDVVTKGRNNGAMPPWGSRLSANEVVMVSAYAASLRGQNKPGRPPEGKPIAAWSAQ